MPQRLEFIVTWLFATILILYMTAEVVRFLAAMAWFA